MVNKRIYLSKEFQVACSIFHIHEKELGDASLHKIIEVSKLRPSVVAEGIKFLQGWSIISLEPIMIDGKFAQKFKYYVRLLSRNNIRELYENYWLHDSERTQTLEEKAN